MPTTSTSQRAHPVKRLVVLGGTGDLATRHLLPAVLRLADRGLLPEDFDIMSLAREELSVAEYRAMVERAAEIAAPDVSADRRQWLVERLRYAQVDLRDIRTVTPRLAEAMGRSPALCYLALPPSLDLAAVRALAQTPVPASTTVVAEKPFGEDLASAVDLNRALHQILPDDSIFRADHFLHHQMAHDVIALRRNNRFLDAVWSREHVESVEIVWEESAPVRGYVEFFDRLGSIRDMVQSHLLQLLALVAMELPTSWHDDALPKARLEALRAVRTPPSDVAADRVVRGRYTAGEVQGIATGSYSDHPGVEPARKTETYVSMQLELDTDRWRGVPFVLRTGKAVGAARRYIDLRWRSGAGNEGADPGSLRIEMNPNQISLGLSVSGPEGQSGAAPVRLAAAQPAPELPPTGRLLRDVLAGHRTSFLLQDEVEEGWRIAEAILAASDAGGGTLREYTAGTTRPSTSF